MRLCVCNPAAALASPAADVDEAAAPFGAPEKVGTGEMGTWPIGYLVFFSHAALRCL